MTFQVLYALNVSRVQLASLIVTDFENQAFFSVLQSVLIISDDLAGHFLHQ
jgi:hypothetical protein